MEGGRHLPTLDLAGVPVRNYWAKRDAMQTYGLEPKSSNPEPVSRRAFLKGAVTAAAGGAVGGGAVFAARKQVVEAGKDSATGMRHRTLGRTGLSVSEVGVGGYPLKDPDLIRYALDQGINYIDTSHCYRGGRSEESIGRGLKGIRDQVVLTTKWCPYHIGKPATKKVFIEMLDKSLRRLRVDHVDILLNHQVGKRSDGVGVNRLMNPEIYEAWEDVKQAGKARFMGVSGHDSDLMDVMNYAVEQDAIDVILCRYSFLDYPDQQKLIDKCAEKNIGFIAMKTLAGAKGADLDNFRDKQTSFKQAALKWVLSNKKVSNLIISMSNRRQVREYAAVSGTPMTSADYQVLDQYAALFSAEVCRYCGACERSCREDVRIADILRFSMYEKEYRQEGRGTKAYAALIASERAAHCAHCAGHCEQACAYDLPIKTLLIDAHQRLASGYPDLDDSVAAGAG